MRGRTKVISLAAMLLIIFTSSMVFASGILDPSKISLLGYTPIEPNAGETLFITPSAIIKDYINNPGYQIGNTFSVSVNVSSVTDLFTYQVNVTWNKAMLNYTGVTYGDFLLRTGSPYGTSRIEPTVYYSNTLGFASIAETILGNVAGITGSGRLFTIQFKVVGYGSTTINLSASGNLPTMLLNSAGSTIAYTTASGYFRNALFGDATLNKIVDSADISRVIYHRTGPPAGPGGYNRDADLNDNGIIDSADISIVIANRGRSTP